MTLPDWTDSGGDGASGARCRVFPVSRDPDGLVRNDTWFQDAAEALPVCNGDWPGGTPCPVRRGCLLYALVMNQHRGVWGGLTEPQRRWVRRNVARDLWKDDEYVRSVVPPPNRFDNYGDEDPDEEATH